MGTRHFGIRCRAVTSRGHVCARESKVFSKPSTLTQEHTRVVQMVRCKAHRLQAPLPAHFRTLP